MDSTRGKCGDSQGDNGLAHYSQGQFMFSGLRMNPRVKTQKLTLSVKNKLNWSNNQSKMWVGAHLNEVEVISMQK